MEFVCEGGEIGLEGFEFRLLLLPRLGVEFGGAPGLEGMGAGWACDGRGTTGFAGCVGGVEREKPGGLAGDTRGRTGGADPAPEAPFVAPLGKIIGGI